MILLVRHGESSLNALGVRHRQEDVPLTSAGLVEAKMTAESLRGLADEPVIVSSPLLRAYGTACVIAAHLGLDAPQVAGELTERAWGQSCEDAAAAAKAHLNRYGRDVVAVTHAGIIKGLLGLDQTPPNGSIHPWT